MTAASDIRISTTLVQHPKYKRLRARLSWVGVAHLFHFLLWVRTNRPSGDLTGMSNEDIELAVDWAGDPGAFALALADVRFLDGVEGAYQVHDWEEHQPWAAGTEDRSARSTWASLCRRYGRVYAAEQMPEYAARLAAKAADPDSANSRKKSANSSQVADEKPAKAESEQQKTLLGSASGLLIAGSSIEKACPASDTDTDTGSGSGSDTGSDTKSKNTLAQQAAPVRPDYSPAFERFWKAYPNAKGKKPAFNSWKRKKLDPRADELIADVEARLSRDRKWREDGGRFIPYGSTYVSEERWEDKIDEIGSAPLGTGGTGYKRSPGEI